ncbi:MAG TPA: DUF302 domain-containing protein [Persephonella sp.]|nr:DUF302 domain-containing protein [Hydrogenothermaceae bacterium]HIQ25267.1 DUF302 domain-containing protein [Persephonella sp.]
MYLNKLLAFAILFTGILGISCSNIKYISMTNHDPWEDEDREKVVSSKSKKTTNETQNNKTKVKDEFIEIPEIYEVSCSIDFKEADLQLKSALEEKNYKIIKISHVTKGMREQGRTDFWENMNIYMVCRLSDGYFVLKHNPWLVGLCPIRIYTYKNEEGKLVIGMFRPSLAMKWMGNPDLVAIKVLKTYDKELKEVIDSVCEE